MTVIYHPDAVSGDILNEEVRYVVLNGTCPVGNLRSKQDPQDPFDISGDRLNDCVKICE